MRKTELRFIGEFLQGDPFKNPGPASRRAADLIVKIYAAQERQYPRTFKSVRCVGTRLYAEHWVEDVNTAASAQRARDVVAWARSFAEELPRRVDGFFKLPPRPRIRPVLIR